MRRRSAARLGLWLLLATMALPARADRVRLLDTDREAAEARVEMVLASQRELLVSAFIFGDDAFTLTSLSLLRDGARRGLDVALLVDAQWNRIPRAVLAHLVAEGVPIREYHPFRLLRPRWIFRRMHDKLLVADGHELLAGGRNVESPYFGFGRQVERRNYLDLDLQVVGDAAGAARDYFFKLWNSRHVQAVRPRATPAELSDASARLDHHKQWLDARVEEARSDSSRPARELREVGPVRFLHDPITDKRRTEGVGFELHDLLGRTKESALIESPYLIPSRALRKSLRAALARGVRVRILTNSLATTDNLWAQAGYVGHRRELVASGIELWEYRGPECLHGKAALLDGETVIVGSYNLDPRSEQLNSELALVASDRGLAAELGTIFEEHLRHAWRIDARGWPEGASEPFPGVSRLKKCKLRFLRLLTPFLKGQL